MDEVRRTSNDELYMLPGQNNIQVLFYNKDLFDRFGVAYPRDGMTWGEMLDLSSRITRKEGDEIISASPTRPLRRRLRTSVRRTQPGLHPVDRSALLPAANARQQIAGSDGCGRRLAFRYSRHELASFAYNGDRPVYGFGSILSDAGYICFFSHKHFTSSPVRGARSMRLLFAAEAIPPFAHRKNNVDIPP